MNKRPTNVRIKILNFEPEWREMLGLRHNAFNSYDILLPLQNEKQRYGESHYHMDGEGHKKQEEKSVITISNTIINPWTVMVELLKELH